MSSLTFEQKVAIFKAEVLKGFELPDEAITILIAAIKTAKLDVPEVKTVTVASATVPITPPPVIVTGAKKQNGYNVFVKEKMAELKNFSLTAAAWKALTKDEQNVYNAKAAASNAASGAVSAPKGSKGLSGWQFYVKQNSKPVKAANPSLSSQDVMKKMGADWKALTKEQQVEWNTKAKVGV